MGNKERPGKIKKTHKKKDLELFKAPDPGKIACFRTVVSHTNKVQKL